MTRHCFFLLLLCLSGFLFPSAVQACGFDFISSCGTNVALSINGSPDSFYTAPCPFGLPFNGADFGPVRTLSLRKAKGATWESCYNNVSGMTLYYRVYRTDSSPSPWQTVALQEDSAVLTGPYTTRYRSATPMIDLTTGLVMGAKYVLEVYFEAEVDTIGDDFIPETTMISNNNGDNYRLYFEYAGPDGPPFAVVPNILHHVNCFGDTTGIAGVSVYGDQSGLFYSWEGLQNNFYALYNLPAGEYRVTVSGAGGYTEAETLFVQQPPPLVLGLSSLQGLGCNGQPGMAEVLAAGGTPGYQYTWSNGQMGEMATFTSAGFYGVTVTDAAFCTASLDVEIAAGAEVSVLLSAEICIGAVYPYRGDFLDAPGIYTYWLPGQGGACDTVEQLVLNVLDPGSLLQSLPDTLSLTCAIPGVQLCVVPVPGLQSSWVRGGEVFETDVCAYIDQAGQYQVQLVQEAPTVTCSAVHNFTVSAPYAVDLSVMVQPANELAPGSLMVHFSWPSGDSSYVMSNLTAGIYCITVETPEGCTRDTCVEVPFVSGAFTAGDLPGISIYPNPVEAGDEFVLESGGDGTLWAVDAAGKVAFYQHFSGGTERTRIRVPEAVGAGPLFLTVKFAGIPQVYTRIIFVSKH